MVQKLEIGALVFISGVVRVKILKFEQARTRHGNSRTWLLGWMSPYTFEIFTLLRRREPDMVGLVSDYDLLALDSGLCIRYRWS
ncbi:hypothetical protein P3L10_022769 [Capsicum annuum]